MMNFIGTPSRLKERTLQLRGDPGLLPDASIVIPVNAQKDLAPLQRTLADLLRYSGDRRMEIVLVINNYPAEEPPAEIQFYQQAGLQVLGIPHITHNGGETWFDGDTYPAPGQTPKPGSAWVCRAR